jgi:hypothetical protein
LFGRELCRQGPPETHSPGRPEFLVFPGRGGEGLARGLRFSARVLLAFWARGSRGPFSVGSCVGRDLRSGTVRGGPSSYYSPEGAGKA